MTRVWHATAAERSSKELAKQVEAVWRHGQAANSPAERLVIELCAGPRRQDRMLATIGAGQLALEVEGDEQLAWLTTLSGMRHSRWAPDVAKWLQFALHHPETWSVFATMTREDGLVFTLGPGRPAGGDRQLMLDGLEKGYVLVTDDAAANQLCLLLAGE